MIAFPNCKINLGLNVTGKRDDGYHNLETVFYPVALKDSLEIIPDEKLNFRSTGLAIDGDSRNNLCVAAYHLLKKEFPSLPAVQIHLHKVIPLGAGLGGGSSDAAFTLLILNKKFRLNLTDNQLMNYALQLGSDCPYFIMNVASFATGRGEFLDPIMLDISSYKIVLVNPGIHVSTKDAFSKLIPAKPPVSVKEIVSQPVETWKNVLSNDFEESVFGVHPEIENIKNELYNQGATYASMTGTGSTVYGLFLKEHSVVLNFPQKYFVATS